VSARMKHESRLHTAALEDSAATPEKLASIIKRPMNVRAGINVQDIFAQLPPATNLGVGGEFTHSDDRQLTRSGAIMLLLTLLF
jgi:hypothetical protein